MFEIGGGAHEYRNVSHSNSAMSLYLRYRKILQMHNNYRIAQPTYTCIVGASNSGLGKVEHVIVLKFSIFS